MVSDRVDDKIAPAHRGRRLVGLKRELGSLCGLALATTSVASAFDFDVSARPLAPAMNRVLQRHFLASANKCFLRARAPLLVQADGCSVHQFVYMRQGHVNMSSSRRVGFGFCTRSLAQDADLVSKKCVPCSSKDLRAMSEQSANELLAKVQGWKLVNEGGILKLQKAWKVKSFTKGLEFFQLVADIAEAEGHHPDLHLVGWNNVQIDIWTHSVGGLTENDFIVAAKINSSNFEHLLRKKAAAAKDHTTSAD